MEGGHHTPYTMIRLQTTNIGKRFGNRILFRKMSLEFTGGKAIAITGMNGSGKSTLIRILAGVLRPTRGTVSLTIRDTIIEREQRPFHVGLVAPYLNLYDALSPAENLGFMARARGFRDVENRIAETLSRVGLLDRKDDFISTFSSGMKQRVRIAAALFSEPYVLLLDEPRSNLDDAGKELVSDVIRTAVSEKKIVVIATNNAEEASSCDETYRIEDYL